MKLLRYSPLILGLSLLANEPTIAQNQKDIILMQRFLPFHKNILIGRPIKLFESFKLLSGCKDISTTKKPKETKGITKKKKVKEIKPKVRLLPVEFYGDLNPRLDAWTNYGEVLSGSYAIINGPFYGEPRALYGKDTLEAYFEDADLDAVLKQFEERNPNLKTKLLRNELLQYKRLPKEVAHVFADGKLMSKDELDLINNLPDGRYVFTFFYKTKNYNDPKIPVDQKQSLPGMFIINKKKDNFYIKPFESVGKAVEEKTKDTINIRKESAEKELKSREPNFEISSGYDSDGFIPLELRVRAGNIYVGPALGFSGGSERNLTTPTINNFYGQGSDKISELYIGLSAGISLSDYLTLNLNPGIILRGRRIDEKILRSNSQVVSHNKDSYSNKYGRASTGISYNLDKHNLKNLSVGANVGYNFSEDTRAHKKNGVYIGFRLGYKF